MEEEKKESNHLSIIKTETLAKISHEFRTPLNSIIGFAHVLSQNKHGHLDEKEVKYVDRILSCGKHLLLLTNAILDIARTESGMTQELHLKECDLIELCRSLLEMMEGQVLGKKKISLNLEAPANLAPLKTDQEKLKLILINLVGNAVKYTEEGSVTVRITANGSGNPERIDVIDTGPGIEPEKIPVILEPFNRLREQKDGGYGLGLSIANSFCVQLGYKLTILSEVGEGSIFSVILNNQKE